MPDGLEGIGGSRGPTGLPSICLGMNVVNAEGHVGRCVASAIQICDRAVIVDTGCTDNTIAEIKDALGDVPLTLRKRKWVGHAHNRTELLKLTRASGAAWTLMLDADMELVIERQIRPLEGKDEYLIPIRDRGLVYPLPLLTSTAKPYYYAGVAHSYLACEERTQEGEILDEMALIDHGGGGHRPGKIERDAELLAAEIGKNPADRRSWFYLAQSYRDLDQIEKAIAAYKIRASLGGWDEEVYQALYQGGVLMCEHINFYEGAKMLFAAADLKHNRAEALRALAGCAISVANKIPFPQDEVLFVEPGAYNYKAAPPPVPLEADDMPPMPDLRPKTKRRHRGGPLKPSEVSAIIVTRGNVDLAPCLATLPYDDVIVWDNSQRKHDYRIFGRYAAVAEAKHPVIYWQDDDVIFTAHDELLAAYQPGVAIANMDEPWVRGAGYTDTVLFGAGSLCDAHLPAVIFGRYFAEHPWDDDILVEADFAFGTLVNWFRVDLGYAVREFTDAPDRLYLQPGQTERKRAMIARCLEMQKLAA